MKISELGNCLGWKAMEVWLEGDGSLAGKRLKFGLKAMEVWLEGDGSLAGRRWKFGLKAMNFDWKVKKSFPNLFLRNLFKFYQNMTTRHQN
jgi:hypothetical protein